MGPEEELVPIMGLSDGHICLFLLHFKACGPFLVEVRGLGPAPAVSPLSLLLSLSSL